MNHKLLRFCAWGLAIFGFLYLFRALSQPLKEESQEKNPQGFNFASLAEVPILANGRVQPFDSVARNSLLMLRSKMTLRSSPGEGEAGDYDAKPMAETLNAMFGRGVTRSATEWLAEVVFHGNKADERPVFRIDNDQVLGDLQLRRDDAFDQKYFSFKQMRGQLARLEEQARLAGSVKQEDRDAYQKAILKTYRAVQHYTQLKMTLLPLSFEGGAVEFIGRFEKSRASSRSAPSGNFRDDPLFAQFVDDFTAFLDPARFGVFAVSPLASPVEVPLAPVEMKKTWLKPGEVLAGVEPVTSGGEMPEELRNRLLRSRLAQVMDATSVDPALKHWFALADAFRNGQTDQFNSHLSELRSHVSSLIPADKTTRVGFEEFFNRFQPFYVATVLYVLIFVGVALGWMANSRDFVNASYALLLLTFALHSFALGSRMWIQERPPVTNLYSSAIFIGWAVCLMGVLLESFYRRGFASIVTAATGFTTLIIAHNLGNDGDTFEMMRAVLDSNFWLSVHVTTVTLGYATTFLAGKIAIIYVVSGFFTKNMDATVAKVVQGMVYGVLCFALLFSFVGTVTGGIWADDSWGRFWGWDPKENGAVMIVLWNALVLHARWGGMARRRGLMGLAIVGNMITSWSWFGTNMLGIGLHSYGFMDAAFLWLCAYVMVNLFFLCLACLPKHFWSSPAAVGLRENDSPDLPAGSAPSAPVTGAS